MKLPQAKKITFQLQSIENTSNGVQMIIVSLDTSISFSHHNHFRIISKSHSCLSNCKNIDLYPHTW